MKTHTARLCVTGGGSAGVGAAIAASRMGVDTILIERDELLGGTSVNSGVSCWEPVAGATGIPRDIYLRMRKIPDATGIYSIGRHMCHPDRNTPPFPGGENVIDQNASYGDTLLRSGTRGIVEDAERVRLQWHGVMFEPEAFDKTVREMLAESGRCLVLSPRSVTEVEKSGDGKIESVTTGAGERVRADYVIDACGVTAVMAGAALTRGEEPRSAFNEPDAPERHTDRYNGVSLIFRCAPVSPPRIEELPKDIPAECWWSGNFPAMCCNHYPNGDLNCNMLPTMSGGEHISLGETAARAECLRRVKSYWHYLQSNYPEFRSYRMSFIFPRIGVRETFRTSCERTLTQNDLLLGIEKQRHDDIIALSDHMMDSHGAARKACGELKTPYGIPFGCLIPKGFSNLLVAGRTAGFSSIAASSCRLSRTMMQLGQAAGTAAALAAAANSKFRDVDCRLLRDCLKQQGVVLSGAAVK